MTAELKCIACAVAVSASVLLGAAADRPGTIGAGARTYSESDVWMVAQTVQGEAGSCDTAQKAAVAWTICNRVDSEVFPATISGVVCQSHQFHGYRAGTVPSDECVRVARDVLARWSIEEDCVGDVGRVLPREYLYFSGDGQKNMFRTEWRNGKVWDWDVKSPYEEAGQDE